MVYYKCPYCEYISGRLSNIRNHFNKINKCNQNVINIDPKSCKYKPKSCKYKPNKNMSKLPKENLLNLEKWFLKLEELDKL